MVLVAISCLVSVSCCSRDCTCCLSFDTVACSNVYMKKKVWIRKRKRSKESFGCKKSS